MENSITQVSIIGYGNVGFHLVNGFEERGIHVTHIYTRSANSNISENTSAVNVNKLTEIPQGQLCIICVPDDQIAGILNQLPTNIPVAYTSGSIQLEDLPQRNQLGVFYPLQTFSKGKELDLFNVPFFIESNDEYFGSTLFDLAWIISKKVKYASSEERKKIHLAAVWVNNFTNHILHIADSYMKQEGLNFDDITPLLAETVNKLKDKTPFEAQTGPARRNDDSIVEEHIQNLEGLPKEIYALISKSIKETYSND